MNESENNGKMDQEVMICTHLLEGESLSWAYYVKEDAIPWKFGCERSVPHTMEDMKKITALKMAELFPETEELLRLETDRSVIFRKGKNSGKWYDFV